MATALDVLPVSSIMNAAPAMTRADATVHEVAALMADVDAGGVVVMDGPAPVGIVTERDIVRKVVAAGGDAGGTPVASVMTRDLVCTGPDVDVAEAAAVMNANRVRRLPVVGATGLVGVVTDRDLLAVSPGLFEMARARPIVPERTRAPLIEEYGQGKCEGCDAFVDALKVLNGIALCDDCLDAET